MRAFERAYLWCVAWNRLAYRLRGLLCSLGAGDELAIVRVQARWQAALIKRDAAMVRLNDELARELSMSRATQLAFGARPGRARGDSLPN